MSRLKGKVCVVTGAGRGIGEAIATCFAQQEATTVIAELDDALCLTKAEELRAQGRRVLGVVTDVTSERSVQAMVDKVLAEFGRVDVLVNNAGINVFGDPVETTLEKWRRCMAVDLDGVWNTTQATLPAMLDAGQGSVINIASVHSFQIIPGCFPYPVAKHGVIGLTRALGVEYGARGVRVNAIAPGYIETQLCVDYWNTFPDPAAARRATYDLHPVKRIGTPMEVAMTAVFLASDEATFINAETIVIDGGRSAVYHD